MHEPTTRPSDPHNRSTSTLLIVLGCLFSLPSFIFLCIAAWLWAEGNDIRKNWPKTEATVTELIREKNLHPSDHHKAAKRNGISVGGLHVSVNLSGQEPEQEKHYLYRPQFTYTVPGADYPPVTFSGRVAANPPKYKVGDTVTVFYKPGCLYPARVDSFEELYVMPCIFGLTGLGGFLAGISMLVGGLYLRRKGKGRAV